MKIIKWFAGNQMVVAFVCAIIFVTPVAASAGDEWGTDYYGGFGSDYSFDWGGSDTSYGWGNDYNYDLGGGDYVYDWGNDTSYSWGSDSNYGWGDDYAYDWGNDYSYGWGDDYAYTYEPLDDYAYTYEPLGNDYAYTYEPLYNDYAYTYEPLGYDYGCGSSCGGGSYYTPTFSSGCGLFCGGGTHTTPGCTSCGGSRYIPTVTVGQPGKSSSYVSNTNTNTNINNITNIDNSINDSFNNYNSNNTSIVVATAQTPIVSTPAPYCTINHALSSGYGYYNSGNVAYLSWTSQNATSAYLSNVGTVGISGSQNVYPGYTTTYTLTVYGINGQSANCSTTVSANTYVPPTYVPPVVHQPYVALTQIPYTGFDFGPIGNAMYWAGLISFAIAGAYLMVYYRGGMLAFAGSMVPVRKQTFAPALRRSTYSHLTPKAPILVEREALGHSLTGAAAEATYVAPVVASLRKMGTTDTMAIVASKDGSMPKIVINRG